MKKTKLLPVLTLATSMFISTSAFAEEEMEKCKAVDKDGKGIIKEGKADCASTKHGCSGGNKSHDAHSWIFVPKGQCDKINKGDFTGVPQEIKDKIEMPESK